MINVNYYFMYKAVVWHQKWQKHEIFIQRFCAHDSVSNLAIAYQD